MSNPTIAIPPGKWTLESSRKYCRRLARSHYENFIVASFFLPKHLKQHFYNVYAYCRISDDLGDESSSPRAAMEALEQWEGSLRACYDGHQRHPVFIALKDTIDRFEIPMAPFADLIHAFKQDQFKKRYETYNELLEYCKYSANPVGRIVLFLFGYRDDKRHRLSDATCTALQLTNHWQDIASDYTRLGRIYIPHEDMKRFHYEEADLRAEVCDIRFVSLMKVEILRARELFQAGLKLADIVDRRLALDVAAFGQCGLEVLNRIERAGCNIFRNRPEIGKWTRARILFRCWRSRRSS